MAQRLNGDRPLAVTPERAARMLGISRNLCYRMVKSGEIPAVRLGEKRWLVPVQALERMLAGAVEGVTKAAE